MEHLQNIEKYGLDLAPRATYVSLTKTEGADLKRLSHIDKIVGKPEAEDIIEVVRGSQQLRATRNQIINRRTASV